MREITVTYRLSDEEESRLRKITEAYRKYIPDTTEALKSFFIQELIK